MKSPTQRTRLLALLLIGIQPFLDVVSYWLNFAGGSNELTLMFRFGLLALTVGLGFAHSRKKRAYGALGIISLLILLLHGFACLQAGYADPVSDLVNLIRVLVLPWTALAFMTFLDRGLAKPGELARAFLVNLGVILLVQIASTLTGTDPHTYAGKGIGLCGWFYDTSSQSAILSMLVPVALVSALNRKPGPLSALLFGTLGLGMLYLYATRLSYFAAVLTGLVLGGLYVLKGAKTRSQGAVLLAVALVLAGLYPVSPMVKNQRMSAVNYELRQEWIDEQLELNRDKDTLEQLKPIYENYLPGLVEQFGLERVAEAYQYRTDCRIAETRPAKLNYSKLLLEDSPGSAVLFGMELSRFVTSSGVYDVENDLHGMFFLFGLLGLGAMLLFLLFFVWQALRAFLRNPPAFFSPEIVGWGLTALMGGAHVYATSGVLRRPNSSFYLAVCLAAVWYLAKSVPKAQKQN